MIATLAWLSVSLSLAGILAFLEVMVFTFALNHHHRALYLILIGNMSVGGGIRASHVYRAASARLAGVALWWKLLFAVMASLAVIALVVGCLGLAGSVTSWVSDGARSHGTRSAPQRMVRKLPKLMPG